jgi:hypothetical protein
MGHVAAWQWHLARRASTAGMNATLGEAVRAEARRGLPLPPPLQAQRLPLTDRQGEQFSQ